MKYVHNRIQIWDLRGGQHFTREITLGPCPHCLGYSALIVSEVWINNTDPKDFPEAVHCGDCGARGPWGADSEAAVQKWNDTMNVETVFITDWVPVPKHEPSAFDDFTVF